MTINSIGGINPLDNVNSTQRMRNVARPAQAPDVINLSDGAIRKAEAYYLAEIAASTPDVRADLVEQIKEKIKNPAYLDAIIVDSAAARIMEAYGL
jgi:negative regulator of flagellin synthesis FlgM